MEKKKENVLYINIFGFGALAWKSDVFIFLYIVYDFRCIVSLRVRIVHIGEFREMNDLPTETFKGDFRD